jgi:preprotein translocase subunit YajC
LPLILIFGLFYAFMIRPQRQRQRRQQALLQELAVGDEVQTAAGMFGTIVQLSDEFAWVELAPGMTIKMLRRAVIGKAGPPQEEEQEPEQGTAE